MTAILFRQRVRAVLGIACALSPLLLLSVLLAPTPAQASSPVTNCTQAGLDQALAAGGPVSFNCGGNHAPATILLSHVTEIISDTVLDGANGGHTVTLDGQGLTRVIAIDSGKHLTVTNLIVANGAAVDGSCVFDSGSLQATNVELAHCAAGSSHHGGGLYVDSPGSATLANANVHDNSAGVSGGGIYSLAALTVTNSYFAHNSAAGNDGGAIWGLGDTRIDGSTFFSNTTSFGWGGALYNQGSFSVTNSTLTDNVAARGGGGMQTYLGTTELWNVTLKDNRAYQGGGLFNAQGVLTVTQSTLSGNSAAVEGGGLYVATSGGSEVDSSTLMSNSAQDGGGFYTEVTTTLIFSNTLLASNSATDEGGGGLTKGNRLSILYSRVTGNSAVGYGGALLNDSGASSFIVNSTFDGNSASEGGVIANFVGAYLTMFNSTLNGNSANGYGGGLFNRGIASVFASTFSRNGLNSVGAGGAAYDTGQINLINVTLSGNRAYYGAGLAEAGQGTALNSTFSGNAATAGGAVMVFAGPSIWLTLTNTILAYSPTGGNCFGPAPASKYSISSDATCALSGPIRGGLDPNGLDPRLTALGQYGGPSLVHMLEHNSPAIDGVIGSSGNTFDQRGQPRPVGLGYDIGAVERQPGDSDVAPWLYLPLTRR